MHWTVWIKGLPLTSGWANYNSVQDIFSGKHDVGSFCRNIVLHAQDYLDHVYETATLWMGWLITIIVAILFTTELLESMTWVVHGKQPSKLR